MIDEHLNDTPRDAPIVLQWLGGNFYGGGVEKRERMLDKFDSLAPAFGDDWWFMSWHAFANHEMDQLETACILVQRSLESAPTERPGRPRHVPRLLRGA